MWIVAGRPKRWKQSGSWWVNEISQKLKVYHCLNGSDTLGQLLQQKVELTHTNVFASYNLAKLKLTGRENTYYAYSLDSGNPIPILLNCVWRFPRSAGDRQSKTECKQVSQVPSNSSHFLITANDFSKY